MKFTCTLCNSTVENQEAFVGSKNEKKIYACFQCFIKSLKPIMFDDEQVYYPLLGTREMQIEDSVFIYVKDGQELAEVRLETYEEGFLSLVRKEIAAQHGLNTKDIIFVIEPFDIIIKEEVY